MRWLYHSQNYGPFRQETDVESRKWVQFWSKWILGHLSEGQGFPCGAGGKERACQCKRCKRRRFNPWVGKIPGGVIRYLAGDKNLRIISGPNFTKIFLFKLVSLVSCPQVTVCCASAVGYCQKDTLTKNRVKPQMHSHYCYGCCWEYGRSSGRRKANFSSVDERRLYEDLLFELSLKDWASLVAQLVKNLPAMREPWVGKIPWWRERLPTPVFWLREFRTVNKVHGVMKSWTLLSDFHFL